MIEFFFTLLLLEVLLLVALATVLTSQHLKSEEEQL